MCSDQSIHLSAGPQQLKLLRVDLESTLAHFERNLKIFSSHDISLMFIHSMLEAMFLE